jgi:drug/metabolite transporter (DMT)-like permease
MALPAPTGPAVARVTRHSMHGLSLVVPLVLTVSGGVLYHLAAKSAPKDIDPALVLVGAYATALLASIAVYLLVPTAPGLVRSARPWHPAVVALGLGAVMIELGYVLTYRAAWPVSVASVLTNGLVAVLLVPLGVGMFGEMFSATRALGIVLCIIGALLLGR